MTKKGTGLFFEIKINLSPFSQGLPDIAPVDNSHKYLIETNPALTDLKQFMSSKRDQKGTDLFLALRG
ncbi:hypothetical protein BLL38_07445 [Pseudomonas gessardii]|nr:hypothetical protein BLL38_07445 [Pseudomonas gessardii]